MLDLVRRRVAIPLLLGGIAVVSVLIVFVASSRTTAKRPGRVVQKRTYINPIDIDYRYNWEQAYEGISYRTGADAAIVTHKDAYYMFQTLADGYWRSTDLIDWTFVTPSKWPPRSVIAPAALRVCTGEKT